MNEIRTQSRLSFGGVVTTVVALAAVVATFGLAGNLDEAADAALQEAQLQHAAAFEAGRQQGRSEMSPVVLEAWRDGISEGRRDCGKDKLL